MIYPLHLIVVNIIHELSQPLLCRDVQSTFVPFPLKQFWLIPSNIHMNALRSKHKFQLVRRLSSLYLFKVQIVGRVKFALITMINMNLLT